ncbi:MAG TPA: Fe(2+)-trafficking protein [Candidatus Polarisedimenticolia bacterium]|nr:Fe(2+)-trafficking protein [Candidatus Polarisedimenticolia bacterium]
MTCRRCAGTKPGLDQPPFGGELGLLIHQTVCADCWGEWQAAQTRLINESRLSLRNPKHQETLTREMTLFLGLG